MNNLFYGLGLAGLSAVLSGEWKKEGSFFTPPDYIREEVQKFVRRYRLPEEEYDAGKRKIPKGKMQGIDQAILFGSSLMYARAKEARKATGDDGEFKSERACRRLRSYHLAKDLKSSVSQVLFMLVEEEGLDIGTAMHVVGNMPINPWRISYRQGWGDCPDDYFS